MTVPRGNGSSCSRFLSDHLKTIRPWISPRLDLYGERCTSDRGAISVYNATAIAAVKLPVPQDRQRAAPWRRLRAGREALHLSNFTHRARPYTTKEKAKITAIAGHHRLAGRVGHRISFGAIKHKGRTTFGN